MDREELFNISYDLMQEIAVVDPTQPDELRKILVEALRKLPGGMGVVSDGHHTIDELYEHRRSLTAVLAAAAGTCGDSWRSMKHHPDDDTPMFEGCFIVGIELPTGQIRYHYGVEYWDEFSQVPEVPWAPVWDGAGPSDTISRLKAAATTLI